LNEKRVVDVVSGRGEAELQAELDHLPILIHNSDLKKKLIIWNQLTEKRVDSVTVGG
jgi:hypothetical protein